MTINPKTYAGLDDLGRVALSDNFFFREFLYSEVAAHYGVQNIPSDCELAIEAGRGLSQKLLEPLNATFGRIVIRSGYRSRELNDLCNEKKHNCGSSESNRARHIWDERDRDGRMGAPQTYHGRKGQIEVSAAARALSGSPPTGHMNADRRPVPGRGEQSNAFAVDQNRCIGSVRLAVGGCFRAHVDPLI